MYLALRSPARRWLLGGLWALLLSVGVTGAGADEPAAIILFRHANAPGVGDPPGMVIGECATQRNLDEKGREQARRIGDVLRERGIVAGAVLSSQWCRARETADLAFPGQAQENPAFNSFFGNRDSEPRQTADARRILLDWKGPGSIIVFTHQVNISALTGQSTASGEGIVLRRVGDSLSVTGRIRLDTAVD